MKSKAWLFLIISPLLSLVMISSLVLYLFYAKYEGPNLEFTIKPGETFGSINYRLKKENIIKSLRVFHYYVLTTGKIDKFKVGTFVIPKNADMQIVLSSLVNTPPISTKVTLPEGKNMYEVAELLEQNQICKKDEFLRLATDAGFLSELSIDADTIEGYLYPETYQFSKNTPPEQVIKTMVSLFKQKTANLDYSQSKLDPQSVLILASIVEKETGAKFERPTIAGVFLNRLNKKMRLESDPTTIYGIWHRFDGNLRKSDLLETTPYNTYKISALPHGPICNPGIEAINAVLNPEKHDHFYFVSKNDGTHIFSHSYNEHQKAVVFYQKNRANREGKSWRDLKQN